MTDDRKKQELEVFQIRRRLGEAAVAAGRAVVQRVREPFLYEGAGRRAPKDVRRAIEKFRSLPLAARAQTQLWAWLLGDGTPPYKFRKEEVQYGPPPPDRASQNCANCISSYMHVTTNTPICDLMRGVIAPTAWCNRWRPPMSAAAYAAYQEREGG